MRKKLSLIGLISGIFQIYLVSPAAPETLRTGDNIVDISADAVETTKPFKYQLNLLTSSNKFFQQVSFSDPADVKNPIKFFQVHGSGCAEDIAHQDSSVKYFFSEQHPSKNIVIALYDNNHNFTMCYGQYTMPLNKDFHEVANGAPLEKMTSDNNIPLLKIPEIKLNDSDKIYIDIKHNVLIHKIITCDNCSTTINSDVEVLHYNGHREPLSVNNQIATALYMDKDYNLYVVNDEGKIYKTPENNPKNPKNPKYDYTNFKPKKPLGTIVDYKNENSQITSITTNRDNIYILRKSNNCEVKISVIPKNASNFKPKEASYSFKNCNKVPTFDIFGADDFGNVWLNDYFISAPFSPVKISDYFKEIKDITSVLALGRYVYLGGKDGLLHKLTANVGTPKTLRNYTNTKIDVRY